MLLLDSLDANAVEEGVLTKDAIAEDVIAGEQATPLAELPEIWQVIAQGTANVGLSNPESYVKMAQLFQYKLEKGEVDLFAERPDCNRFKQSFGELFGQLAKETLEFYGKDFEITSYPDFQSILRMLRQTNTEPDRLSVARIGQELFETFGYDLPASFYHVNLAPIYRDHVFEERALRFDPRDREHKRPWDAALHAGKVYAIQMKMQSIASQYGLVYQHGCGCDSHISSIDKAVGAFDYEMNTPKRDRWIRSFVWTAWYEYAFFGLIPNTAYLSLA